MWSPPVYKVCHVCILCDTWHHMVIFLTSMFTVTVFPLLDYLRAGLLRGSGLVVSTIFWSPLDSVEFHRRIYTQTNKLFCESSSTTRKGSTVLTGGTSCFPIVVKTSLTFISYTNLHMQPLLSTGKTGIFDLQAKPVLEWEYLCTQHAEMTFMIFNSYHTAKDELKTTVSIWHMTLRILTFDVQLGAAVFDD